MARSPALSVAARGFWAAVFAMLAMCAFAWWLLMPSGFPVGHPRFWSNAVLPWIWLSAAGTGVYASVRAPRLLRWLCVAPGAGAASALMTMRVLHPLTAESALWWGAGCIAMLLCALAFATIGGRSARTYRWPSWLAFVGLGALLPLSLRAPPPSTRPLGGVVSEQVDAEPDDSAIVYERGLLRLELRPTLKIGSQSPDGAWTLFAPAGSGAMAKMPRCTIRRDANDSGKTVLVDSRCALDEAVFSHLNDFASLRVSGHRQLSIGFSPIRDRQFDVLPADYPEGRPIRFGYVDAGETFRVVEADSAEKGPFRELGSGPLRRGDALGLTLFDQGAAYVEVIFFDWSAQLSTEASPTAGWGVAQNALTFRRLGAPENSPCDIDLTLAATGIGRGFDSVGHAPGSYRNRVQMGPTAD